MVEQIRRMRGGSQAHLMRSSTNSYYVVKFQDNPQGTRILVNELFGTLLAARLGLPTTQLALCFVNEDLIKLTPDLCVEIPRGRIPCRRGLQFGSRFSSDPHRVAVFDFIPGQNLSKVKNLRDFLGMLVFDKWVCNVDGRQTIFYPTEVDGQYQTAMIDQGFCFNASEWSFPDAPLRGLYCQHAVYRQVHGIDDFEPWLTKLESEIGMKVLLEIAETVPPEWYEFDSEALHRLLERLDARRCRVRELLFSSRRASPSAFPNWAEQNRTQGENNHASQNNADVVALSRSDHRDVRSSHS